MLRLDLSGVTVGQAVFKIGPEMFNVPRQTDVTRISPSQIVLDIDRIVDRQVPIHVSVQGQPAAWLSRRVGEGKPARRDRARPQPLRLSHR